jgi:hypothetical protein
MNENSGNWRIDGFCMLEYARKQSIVDIQRNFRSKFGKDLPVRKNSKQWYEKFQR